MTPSNKLRGLARMGAVLLAVIVAALAIAACGGSDEADSASSTTGDAGATATTIRAAFVPGATFLPAMVAKDAGIFDRHGLDVTLTPTQTVSTIPGALGRQLDIGPAVPPVLIKAVGSGIPIVGVAASSVEREGNASELIVAGDSPIQSVADLRGRRIGTADSGAALHGSMLNWLALEGVDPKSVTAIEMPFPTMADQLRAGRVDAVEAIQPFSEIMIRAGARSLGAPMLSVAKPKVLSTLWIAQRDWAERNADVVERWVDSLVEAQDLIERQPKRARAILQRYTQLPPAITETVKLPDYDAAMGADALAQAVLPWQEALGRAGVFEGDLTTDQFVVEGS